MRWHEKNFYMGLSKLSPSFRRIVKRDLFAKVLKSIWNSACKYDGIPEGSSFVVFSDDNPFVKLHTRGMAGYQNL